MAVWTLYSHPWVLAKGRPVFGNLVHLSGGVFQFLLGYVVLRPVDATGFFLALYFAGIFAAGHLNHEVMDHDADKLMGLRTNAVVFGPKKMLYVAFAFFTLWAAYIAALTVSRVLPVVWTWPFLAIFPFHAIALAVFRPGPTETYRMEYQKLYRALYLTAGLVVLTTRIARLAFV
ncbi:MAG: UbiA family prenyltransferase [Deltaproteobacteria bacterium]|nr:UbiA family prenyltransferase [Deltaproteobacteria bacterium]